MADVIHKTLFIFVLMVSMSIAGEAKIIIAHRGASGYLPEHTLPAKAMAYAQGAHFLEQDCVLSKDGHVVVLHDIHLDTVTDVAERFPTRARSDGRYYAIDFTLAEIKTLNAHERVDLKTGKPYFPKRFSPSLGRFEVPTLAEEIELVAGLNKSTGRRVGIYPEIKQPAWHRTQGHDLSLAVLKVLKRYGYENRSDAVFVQCFDMQETRRLREELKSQLRLVQLISDPVSSDEIKQIAEYADGIGPAIKLLVKQADKAFPEASSLVRLAHEHQLLVHPWTVRSDALPEFVSNENELLEFLFAKARVDGVFTDFPDTAVEFLNRQNDDSR